MDSAHSADTLEIKDTRATLPSWFGSDAGRLFFTKAKLTSFWNDEPRWLDEILEIPGVERAFIAFGSDFSNCSELPLSAHDPFFKRYRNAITVIKDSKHSWVTIKPAVKEVLKRVIAKRSQRFSLLRGLGLAR